MTGGCGGGVSGSRGAPSVSVHRDDIVAAWSGGDVVRYGPRGRLLSLRRGASPPPVAVVDGERGPLVLAHEAGEPHGVLVAYDVSARAPEAIWEAPSDTEPGSRQRLLADARAGWRTRRA